jgi:hypothetical protein
MAARDALPGEPESVGAIWASDRFIEQLQANGTYEPASRTDAALAAALVAWRDEVREPPITAAPRADDVVIDPRPMVQPRRIARRAVGVAGVLLAMSSAMATAIDHDPLKPVRYLVDLGVSVGERISDPVNDPSAEEAPSPSIDEGDAEAGPDSDPRGHEQPADGDDDPNQPGEQPSLPGESHATDHTAQDLGPTTEPADGDETTEPDSDPSDDPTAEPTESSEPDESPTSDPTTDPTTDPTDDPTTDPTDDPSSSPDGGSVNGGNSGTDGNGQPPVSGPGEQDPAAPGDGDASGVSDSGADDSQGDDQSEAGEQSDASDSYGESESHGDDEATGDHESDGDGFGEPDGLPDIVGPFYPDEWPELLRHAPETEGQEYGGLDGTIDESAEAHPPRGDAWNTPALMYLTRLHRLD